MPLFSVGATLTEFLLFVKQRIFDLEPANINNLTVDMTMLTNLLNVYRVFKDIAELEMDSLDTITMTLSSSQSTREK